MKIKVRSGQNVTLQCQGPRGLNITMLEWSKPEFNSESYVFFFQNHRLYENYQHESYKGRVALKDRSMKDGDVSVILRNVNINDTGMYSCEITTRMKGRVVHEVVHSINLTVTDSDENIKDEEEDGKNMDRTLPLIFVQRNVTAGQNVLLPCRAPNINSNPRALVEWSRADLGSDYVLLYQDKQFDPDNQHSSFVNRADLQDRQMKDGDVSLILKDVTINDAGTYECHVGQKSGELMRLISIITLSVVDPPGHTGGLTEDGGKEDGHAGLIVGLIVFALILVAVVLIYRKHKKQNQDSY